jgi:hypothetical protein
MPIRPSPTASLISYDDISEMWFLADTLNGGSDEPVWENVSDSTPQLKFML